MKKEISVGVDFMQISCFVSLIFAACKLENLVNWNWFIVISPILATASLVAVLLVVYYITSILDI